jgi:CrcB protein
MAYVWIALGSALGGVLRYWLAGLAGRGLEALIGAPQSMAFLGTVFVNISGSFVIGLIAALGPTGPSDFAKQLFMIGVLGGYTTFSSFSLQTLELAHEGRWLHAGGNVLISVVFSLAAVWLGHLCGTAFRR